MSPTIGMRQGLRNSLRMESVNTYFEVLRAKIFEDKELPWKPFGMTLTYKEWEDLVSWYIQKRVSDNLDRKEASNYAHNLYP